MAKQYTRKITRASTHSYTVNIPKEFIEKFGWKEKQKVVVVDKGRKRLEIKDWKQK